MKKIAIGLMLVMLVLLAIDIPSAVAQPSVWPSTWTGITTDPNEGGGKDFRDVFDTDGDGYALYYAADSQYFYLRMETVTTPGWPSTGPQGQARYKLWFDTAGTTAYRSGTTVYDAEYLIMLEDLTDNSNDPDTTRDQLGEMTLMDDLNNDGFTSRWDTANPPSYTINNAQTAPTGASTWWRRELGSGTPGLGGPQGVMGTDIGYRIDNSTTGGNFVDIYVSWAALGNPSSLSFLWGTDNQDTNLDQAPNLDSQDGVSGLPLCVPPTASASSNSPVCEGETIELYGGPGGMSTYSWTGPNGFTSSSQDPTITSATTAMSGTYTLTVTDGGCTSDPVNTSVTVNTKPTASASSNSPVCEGETIELYGDPDGMSTYSWTGPNGFTSSSQDPTITSATTAMSGTYTLTVTDGGCTSDPVNTSVTVNTKPTASASSNSPVCEGETIELYGDPDGMSTYSWTGPNGFTSSSQDPTILSATTAMSGTYTLTVTDGGCTSDPVNTSVTVNTKPTASASSNSPVCEGETIELYGDPDGMSTYSWTGPNGFTSSSQDPTITSATTAMSGTYTLTVTDGGCTSDPVNTSVTVNTKPTASASSNSPVCEGETIELYGDPDGMSTYSWTGPNGFTSSSQDPTITSATTAMSGTYTLTVTDGGCTSDPVNTSVTVNTKPTASASSNSPVCEGETIELYGDPDGMSTYSWTGPNGFTSSSQDPTILSATTAMSGTYTLTVTDGGCTSDPVNTSVTVNTKPTASASSNSPVCEGETIELYGDPDGMSTYSWTGPNGFTSSSQDPTITSATTAMSGTYTLTVTDGGCTSDPVNTSVTVNTKPTASASSNSPVCEGETIELYGDPDGMSTYSWTGPNGFTSSSQDPTILSATTAMSGTYTLTVTDGGCTSDPVNTSVTVNTKPTASASSNSPVCEGETIELYGDPDGMSTYSWTGPNGFTSSSQDPTITSATTAMSGTYTLTVTDGGCTSDPVNTSVTVNTKPTASASSNSPVCEGETIELYGDPDGMSTYSWTGPNGFTSSSQDPTILSATTAMSGTYTLTVTDGGCTSDPVNTSVTVNTKPTASASSNSPVCEGETIELYGDPDGMSTYSWTGPNGFTSSSQDPTILSATTAMSGTYTLTVTDGGCTSDPVNTSVTVNTKPTASASSNSPVCEGETIELYGDPDGMSTYSWTGPNGFTSSSQDPTITSATTAMSGTYTLTVTDGGCTSDPVNTSVTVNTKPTASASSNSPVCEGETIELYGDPDGMSTYSWTGPNGFTSSSQDPTILSATTAMSGTYTLTVTDGGCTSDPVNTSVTVNTKPTASASSNSPVCEGETIELYGDPDGMSTYSWTGPNGFTSSSQDPTITSATTAMSGTYTLTVTDGGCTSDPVNTSVTVNTKPTASASSNSPVCEGETIELYGDPDGMSTYSWTGPNGFTSSSQDPTITSATTAMSGTYTLTVTDGGCTSDPVNTSVTVNTKPTASASSNSPVCEGETIELYGDPDGMSTYSWTGPNGFTSSSQDPTITSATTAMSGTYTLTVTDGGCTSDPVNTSVTVNTKPTASASSNSPVCEGETIELYGDPDGMSTYSWTGPNGFTSSSQDPTITSATTAMSGTYTLTVTDGGCTSDPVNTSVTVNTAPVANFNADMTSGCAPLTVQFTDTSTGSPTSWSWSFPGGSPLSANTQGPHTVTYSSPGTYTVSLTVSNACGSDGETKTSYITVSEAPTASASSNSPVSEGADIQLYGGPDGMITYSWTGPGGWTTNAQNATRTGATLTMAGTYTLTVTNNNGCSDSDTTDVIVNIVTYNISGTIWVNGTPLEGVLVTGSSDSWTGTAITDADGEYVLTGVPHGETEIHITPTLAGYTFVSPIIIVTDPMTTSLEHQDFAATLAECGYDGVVPTTYAKIPFAIIESGLMLVGDIIALLPVDLGIPAWLSTVTDTIATWSGGPLSWTVDMLGWGLSLVGGILDTLAPTLGLPDWLGDVLNEVACGLFTPFECVVPGAPPFDPCG